MTFKKNLLFLSIFVLISLALGFFNLLPARAQTLEQLLDEIAGIEAQLQDLRAQLRGLQSSLPSCAGITFQRSLKEGMSGPDVKCLQALLNTDPATQVALIGLGSFGNESNYFGPKTVLALAKFQEKYANDILTPSGLTKGTGFAGPRTISKLNSLLTQPLSEPTAPEAPTVSLIVDPTVITSGQSSTLSWTSTNTSSCSGTNFPTNQTTSGTASVSPTSTTTYFISCTGPQGSSGADVTVAVVASPPSGGGSAPSAPEGGGEGVVSPPSAPGGGVAPAPSAPGGGVAPAPSKDAGCFLAGTKITMADGTYKNIEEVKVGDLVRYYDFKGKVMRTTKVTKIYNYLPEQMSSDFYLVINNKLRVTPSQPLDTSDGKMILAGDLKIGNRLQGEDGVVEIFSIDKAQQRATTYYIETESGHYFVDGISDTLKVFKAIDNLFASIVSVISKLVIIIERMR